MQNQETINTDPLADFTPVDQFTEKHKDKLNASQIRWLARFRKQNGLAESGAMVKVSNRLYINEPKFANWFASQRA